MLNQCSNKISIVEFIDYNSSVFKALDELNISEKIFKINKFVIKPNLVTADPPPTTTDVRCVEAIIKYILNANKNANIIIAEGTADNNSSTFEAYKKLRYTELEKKYSKVKLVDLNTNIVVSLKNSDALVLKELKVSSEILNAYFISVPVLKDHSLNTVTLSIKNLIGILPEKFYSGYWNFKKSMVHKFGTDKVIFDLYNYVKINLAVIDGAIGQKDCHLTGPACCPPVKRIIASEDALGADIAALKFLNHKLDEVVHLKLIKSATRSSEFAN